MRRPADASRDAHGTHSTGSVLLLAFDSALDGPQRALTSRGVAAGLAVAVLKLGRIADDDGAAAGGVRPREADPGTGAARRGGGFSVESETSV